jgi:hypothetical protein
MISPFASSESDELCDRGTAAADRAERAERAEGRVTPAAMTAPPIRIFRREIPVVSFTSRSDVFAFSMGRIWNVTSSCDENGLAVGSNCNVADPE